MNYEKFIEAMNELYYKISLPEKKEIICFARDKQKVLSQNIPQFTFKVSNSIIIA